MGLLVFNLLIIVEMFYLLNDCSVYFCFALFFWWVGDCVSWGSFAQRFIIVFNDRHYLLEPWMPTRPQCLTIKKPARFIVLLCYQFTFSGSILMPKYCFISFLRFDENQRAYFNLHALTASKSELGIMSTIEIKQNNQYNRNLPSGKEVRVYDPKC